jgi:hypothetical protein
MWQGGWEENGTESLQDMLGTLNSGRCSGHRKSPGISLDRIFWGGSMSLNVRSQGGGRGPETPPEGEKVATASAHQPTCPSWRLELAIHRHNLTLTPTVCLTHGIFPESVPVPIIPHNSIAAMGKSDSIYTIWTCSTLIRNLTSGANSHITSIYLTSEHRPHMATPGVRQAELLLMSLLKAWPKPASYSLPHIGPIS